MSIRSVTLVGGNGTLGSKILESLLAAGCFDVTVVKRASSTSGPSPDGVRVLRVPDDLPFQELEEAFRSQDAVISSFRLHDPAQHVRVAEAAAAAGVRRFVPADFGSCEADSPRAQEFLQLYRDKEAVRRRVAELARAHADFSWTSIVCGHFFDAGIHDGLLHIDPRRHTIDLLDGGADKASTSTLRRIGEATVRVLQRAEATRNRVLYIQSFCVTQREVLAALERASGTQWTANYLDSAAYLESLRDRAAAGDSAAIEDVVFVLGTVDANWATRDGFAMKLLGLEDEDLDTVVAEALSQTH